MCKAIDFHGFSCCIAKQYYVIRNHYAHPRIALILEDPDEGEIIATATINIPEEKIAVGEVIIKDYSENEGMFNVLYNAGIISKPVRFVQSGFINSPVCNLLI